jgi:lipid-A-disaccharide synthase
MSNSKDPQDYVSAKKRSVMIVAGEASGDLHGSNLVRAMLSLDPNLRFFGVGGNRMAQAGVNLMANVSDMAVVGLTEVIAHLGRVIRVMFALKRRLHNDPPDLVILIDYPDFNLPLATTAKKQGIKVFYYISPQVWAWRKKRISRIRSVVDHMAVILPFEVSFYAQNGVSATFVGHPLLDAIGAPQSREEARHILNIPADVIPIGLLPGSRPGEIKRLLPLMLKAAAIIKKSLPAAYFILPLADSLPGDIVDPFIAASDIVIQIVHNKTYTVMSLADAALVASGTATLETALFGTPMVIVYKVSPLSYAVGKMVISVKNIGLVNIVGGKTIVPELIQADANPERMAAEILSILTNRHRQDEIRKDLSAIREKLGEPGASARTARLAYDLINM